LIAAGAVGMNLEDMEGSILVPLHHQLERIRTVLAVATYTGVPIVLNARTDIYLAQVGDSESRFERTVERIVAFAEAGADSVFVPGVKDEETIARLARSVDAPLNILATVGSPSIPRLRELGVARISVGSGPMRAGMALMRRIALEMRDSGTYDAFTRDTIDYADANRLFER
jgi:2-methylisocitrate lyase-like PEP mutase family enzyme